MSTELHVADDLDLPLDAVTETLVFIGKRGSGKSHNASVLAEEMIKAGQTVAIIDPLGAWYGLRSSLDGNRQGLPVVILGGKHGDLPLPQGSGRTVADLLIAERMPMVLDLSTIEDEAEQCEWVGDFLRRLYHAQDDQPLHLMIDEADIFAPQTPTKHSSRSFGPYNNIVRRGRIQGRGITTITQRTADLHKSILSQSEVLVAHRLTDTRDIKAVSEWMTKHGIGAELRETLPKLPIGTAWVCSAAWLETTRQIAFRRRETFDSSATPKVGTIVQQPRAFAAMDTDRLDRLAKLLAEDEDDEQTSPETDAELARLRAEAKTLRERLAQATARPPEQVEVPVLTDWDRATLANALTAMRRVWGKLEAMPTKPSHGEKPPQPMPARSTPPAPSKVSAPRSESSAVSRPRQHLLNTLYELEQIGITAPTKQQLALWAEVSAKSSGYHNNLSGLRTQGLLDYPATGSVCLTGDGRNQATLPSGPILTDVALHARIKRVLPVPRWRLIEVLIDAAPRALSKDELAERAGVSSSSSGYHNNVSGLRTQGLLTYPSPGMVRVSDIVFLEA